MKTKNVAVGILAAVLTTALWYTFLLKPTRSQASKVKAETATEHAKLQPLQAQLAKAKRDAAHASSFKAQLASLQLAMPDSPALAAFIRDANGIADASGVAWQSVSHASPAPGAAGVMAIAVGITIKGTYPQVMDYLGRLAELQRLVVVDNVQFNAAASVGGGAGGGAGAPGGAGAGGDASGGSTGPFSGGTSLTATIAARMFETPSAAVAIGAGGTSSTGTATTGATTPTQSGRTPTLNNS